MIKLLDIYIIKKFLGTFFFSLLLIISISVVFDISEKLDDFIEKKAPLEAIVFDYYFNFIPYFANLFSPLFVFISVIYFTSKMAYRTEIVAILASGVSFKRFLLPYLIASTVIACLSFYLNNFMIPNANKVRLDFEEAYIRNSPYRNYDKDIHRQITPNDYIYFESYNNISNIGYKFSLETFAETGEMTRKLTSDYIRWDSLKNKWAIHNYHIREIKEDREIITKGALMDTVMTFTPDEFGKRDNSIESMDYYELNKYIASEKFKGSAQVPFYEIEKYRRGAFPFATFILTLIGVSIASRKVRGGIGLHIGAGLLLSFSYILFMQVSTTFATNAGFSPMIAVWIPNVLYGIIAVLLFRNAPK